MLKNYTAQAILEARYRNQFCVNPATVPLDDLKYIYFITGIIAGGGWTADIIGFHHDDDLNRYTRTGTGNLYLPVGMEITAQKAVFTGASLVTGFTLKNISYKS